MIRIAAALLLFAAACTATPPAPPPDADDVAALHAALDMVDPDGNLTFSAEAPLLPALREAAGARRKVIDKVTPTAEQSLPAKHALVKSFDRKGDKATVRVVVGPVPIAKAGQALLDCGTTYTVNLEKKSSGGWAVKGFGIAQC